MFHSQWRWMLLTLWTSHGTIHSRRPIPTIHRKWKPQSNQHLDQVNMSNLLHKRLLSLQQGKECHTDPPCQIPIRLMQDLSTILWTKLLLSHFCPPQKLVPPKSILKNKLCPMTLLKKKSIEFTHFLEKI